MILNVQEELSVVKNSESIMNAASRIKAWLQNEDGATAIEYGLIAAAFGMMLISILPVVSTELSGLYYKLSDGAKSVNDINW